MYCSLRLFRSKVMLVACASYADDREHADALVLCALMPVNAHYIVDNLPTSTFEASRDCHQRSVQRLGMHQ